MMGIEEIIRTILGQVLFWSYFIASIALIYALIMLIFGGGNLGNMRDWWNNRGDGGSGGSRGDGGRRPPRTPREAAERRPPPGPPTNVHHRRDGATGMNISWNPRPETENVVEYEIQRREIPATLGPIPTTMRRNWIRGWKQIGRSNNTAFHDDGRDNRSIFNIRRLTSPGTTRYDPSINGGWGFEYRVRAIDADRVAGGWGYSHGDATRQYDLKIEIADSTGPASGGLSHLDTDITAQYGNVAGMQFVVHWFTWPKTQESAISSLVNGRIHTPPTGGTPLYTTPSTTPFVLTNNPPQHQDRPAPATVNVSWNTIHGRNVVLVVCVQQIATGEVFWCRNPKVYDAQPPRAPMLIIPGHIRGGRPVIGT